MLHGFHHHGAAQQQDPARGHEPPEQLLEKEFVEQRRKFEFFGKVFEQQLLEFFQFRRGRKFIEHGILEFREQFEQHRLFKFRE
jgi:hypothetical protein